MADRLKARRVRHNERFRMTHVCMIFNALTFPMGESEGGRGERREEEGGKGAEIPLTDFHFAFANAI